MKRTQIIALLSPLALAAAPAWAEQAVAQHVEAQPPLWSRAATEAEVKAAFKDIDPATLPPGPVTLRCRVKDDGTFTRCEIVSQTPLGRTRITVASLEGKPVASDPSATSSGQDDRPKDTQGR